MFSAWGIRGDDRRKDMFEINTAINFQPKEVDFAELWKIYKQITLIMQCFAVKKISQWHSQEKSLKIHEWERYGLFPSFFHEMGKNIPIH